MFKIMSTGRVQGPASKIIVDKELKIRAFKPTPYWQINCTIKRHTHFKANHQEDTFTDKKRAEDINNKCKGKPKRRAIDSRDTAHKLPDTL